MRFKKEVTEKVTLFGEAKVKNPKRQQLNQKHVSF